MGGAHLVKKPLVHLRGHHLHLLYCYVFKGMKDVIVSQNKDKFKGENLEQMIGIYEQIKAHECDVKVVEGIDSLCEHCDNKNNRECKELIPDEPNAIMGDKAFIFLLSFRKNRIYTAKSLLGKLKKKYKKHVEFPPEG